MARITLNCKTAHFSFDSYEAKAKQTVLLAAEMCADNTLTIGDSYIFADKDAANYKRKSNDNKLKDVDCQVTIEKISKIGAQEIKRLKLSKSKIGNLRFFKEIEDTDDMFYSNPVIVFTVYVADELYNLIYENILNKNSIAHLSFDIEKLDFSWEPDGKHTLWKIVEDKKQKHQNYSLDINEMNITFNPIPLTITKEIIEKEKEVKNNNEVFYFKTLNTIKVAVIISAVAAALTIFTKLF